MTIPNPGSKEAKDLGCTCPDRENCYGKGIHDVERGLCFYYDLDCPVHCATDKDQKNKTVQLNE